MAETTANTKPIFQKNPEAQVLKILPADTTTLKTLFTAGSEGALVDHIAVTSTDTAAVVVELYITESAVDYKIGEVSVAIGSGTDSATPSLNLLNNVALPFLQVNGGLPLGASQILKVAAKATITAATEVHFIAFGGEY